MSKTPSPEPKGEGGGEEEEEDGELPYHTIVIDCAPIGFVDSMGVTVLEQVDLCHTPLIELHVNELYIALIVPRLPNLYNKWVILKCLGMGVETRKTMSKYNSLIVIYTFSGILTVHFYIHVNAQIKVYNGMSVALHAVFSIAIIIVC